MTARSKLLTVKPEPGECAPYYRGYVDQVPETDVIAILEDQIALRAQLLAQLSDEKARFRYADGKWSIKEIVGHLSDAERIFAYRALRIARGDATPLSGFEQDDYVAATNFDRRPFPELLDELDTVRRASLSLFRSLTDDELMRKGTASDNPFVARVIPFIIAGHEIHHIRILRERYLS
ncbi:MAG: DinB family protein [bacterium]